MKKTALSIAVLASSNLLMAGTAFADLNLYCSAQEEWCQVMEKSFEEATGIDVAMTRKSSGETFAQIKAEASNPKGDVWWGGTGDPHLQAAEEDLTEPYVSPMRDQLHPWAVAQATSAGDKTHIARAENRDAHDALARKILLYRWVVAARENRHSPATCPKYQQRNECEYCNQDW